MDSDHTYSPLLQFSLLDELSTPSTTVVELPDSIPAVTFTPQNEKQRSLQVISMGNLSRRLTKRKELNNKLCVVNNIMCGLGLLGVLLMIIENEITFINIYEKETIYSWFIKLIISITTLILVGLVFYYHYLDLSLYAANNSLDNWRIGLTRTAVLFAFFEAFICAIHPVPRAFPRHWNLKYENLTASDSIPLSYISIDIALGLPMFARVYLLCRFITYHSHLFRDGSSQSLGYLNEVSINFFFLIKTYLEQWPIRVLLIICSLVFFIGSWSLRVCNYKSDYTHLSMQDSMWLFVVTFTTVGYGDITPSTYCGRSVAAIVALVGLVSSALLISVLTQKLQLTRSEKYVHSFVLKIELQKECREQAANIIKFALKVWALKRKTRPTSPQYITAQRRLFRSILLNQQLKKQQRQLIDSCVGVPELLSTQRESSDKVQDNTEKLSFMELKVNKIEEKMNSIIETTADIKNLLQNVLDKTTK